MPNLRVRLSELSDNIAVAIQSMAIPVASAATEAVRTAGEALKARGRSAIAAAGFSRRWQNTFRVNYYPPKGESIDAAAFAYHRIPYAGVFDEPMRIPGKPLLWVPIKGAAKLKRGLRTPKQLAASGVKLFSINRPGRPPLLATKVRGAGESVTLSKLRKGAGGKRGEVKTLPLFVGLSAIQQRKKFGIAGLADAERDRLPQYYDAALKVD